MLTLDVKIRTLSPKRFACYLPIAVGPCAGILDADFWGTPSMEKGEATHTVVPCWMTAALPPRYQCMSWFAPALSTFVGSVLCFYPHVVFQGDGSALLGENGEELTFVPLNRMGCSLVGSSSLTFVGRNSQRGILAELLGCCVDRGKQISISIQVLFFFDIFLTL
jgi:hypothetical protein